MLLRMAYGSHDPCPYPPPLDSRMPSLFLAVPAHPWYLRACKPSLPQHSSLGRGIYRETLIRVREGLQWLHAHCNHQTWAVLGISRSHLCEFRTNDLMDRTSSPLPGMSTNGATELTTRVSLMYRLAVGRLRYASSNVSHTVGGIDRCETLDSPFVLNMRSCAHETLEVVEMVVSSRGGREELK